MNLSVDYGNVGRSESIDYNVMRNLQRLGKHIELGEGSEVHIWIQKQNSTKKEGHKMYEVGLFLRGRSLKAQVYISKIDNVLSRCMGKVFRSAQLKARLRSVRAEDKFGKLKSLREIEKKQNYDFNISPPNGEILDHDAHAVSGL